jgi:hypothetical protein
MKSILRIFLLTIIFSSIVYAQEVIVPPDVTVPSHSLEDTGVCYITLVWDANLEPDLKGYRIYQSATSGSYEKIPKVEIKCGPGDNTCCEYRLGPMDKGVYYWVATAFDVDDNESDYSTELSHTFKTCVGSPKRFSVKRKREE